MPLSDFEIQAMESTLKELGEYVSQTENGRPLSEWSKDEILGLVRVCCENYRKHMNEICDQRPHEPPL